MTKRNWFGYIVMIAVCFLISGCSLLDNLLFTKSEVPEFSFSGYVRADGEPLADATVDCGISSCQTDENGYYSFNKLSKVVNVSVSKAGYLFSDELVFVNSLSTDVNFYGYKLFDKSGVVKNNDVVIPNVKIEAVSENGKFETMTNESGEFYLSNLAGQVKVTATKEKYNFFTQSFTIAKEDNVVITGITDIAGKINVDSKADKSDFELLCNDYTININDDLTFLAQNVAPGDKIILKSSKYFVSKNEIKIGSTDDISFDCFKYYDIQGEVSCGNQKLNNVKVMFGKLETESINGKFKFEKVYGSRDIKCELNGFEFENKNVSADNSSVQIKATTKVEIQVALDVGNDFSGVKLKVGDRIIDKCSSTGKFEIAGIEFGQVISVESLDYHADTTLEVNDNLPKTISLQKHYSLKVNTTADNQPLSDVDVIVSNKTYKTDENGFVQIDKLYGTNECVLEKTGYKFESTYLVNYYQSKINAVGQLLFDIVGSVRSGEIILDSAKIVCNDVEYSSNELGEFQIQNVYGVVNLTIEKSGYNTQTLSVSKDGGRLDINLNYDVMGLILCADMPIEDVKVSNGQNSVNSQKDGKFKLSGLYGENEITFAKDFYNIQSQTLSFGKYLQINTTYSVKGNVSSSNGAVSGLGIWILSKNYGTTQSTTTDEKGNYSFEGLSGSYALYYDESTSLSLKPKIYNVNFGDKYDFSDKGFGFGGKVTCGGVGLEGVKIRIGNLQTLTDKDGAYNFALVPASGILTLTKEGYNFENSGMDVDEEFDGRENVNFEATYKVVIRVKSGLTTISNVQVSLNGNVCGNTDENGTMEILGLTGSNSVEFSLNKYKFVGLKTFDTYQVLDIDASMDIAVLVKTGDIRVGGAEVKVNGVIQSSQTDNNGLIELKEIRIGDTIEFSKTNYKFDSILISGYLENLIANCSYKISGNISNCGNRLAGVTVTMGERVTLTDELGYFEFDDVQGEQTLRLSKNGFDFDDVIVNSADTLNIMSKYSIAGKVMLSTGLGISKVDIYIAEQKVGSTDTNGNFKIENLSSIVTLRFVKLGYKFVGDFTITSPSESLEFLATYSIAGRVMSGNIAIANALVSASNGMSTRTNDDGTYVLEDVDTEVVIQVTLDNYDNTEPETVKGYSKNVDFNLTYKVIITIDGDFKDINVSITGQSPRTKNYSLKQIIIENLFGQNSVVLSKKSYMFTPTDRFTVTSNFETRLTTKLVYGISGFVKTESGAPIKNARVFAGETCVRTDNQGYYEISNLIGKNQLMATLPYLNDDTNPSHDSSLDKTYGQIEKSGDYNIIFSNNNFGLNFLNFAYDKLRNSNGYQIFGTGDVVATAKVGVTITSKNKVDVIYKQDKNGTKIFQNKNTGDVEAGVDPNVSMLSCFDTKSRTVKYQLIQGENNVKANSVAYTNSWSGTNISYSDYQSKITINGISGGSGVNGDGFSSYNINSKSLSSVKNMSFSDNLYKYTIVLKTDEASGAYTNYKQIMTLMCDKKDLIGFSKIELTFTISQSGYLKEMKIAEEYKVVTNKKASVSGAEASVVGNITYSFYLNQNNLIKDIDTSSPITASSGLSTLETYDDILTLQTNKNTRYSQPKIDMVVVKKEELLWKN